MTNLRIGMKVRVGGSLGPIEIITAINGDSFTLVSPDGNCTGFISKGDAPLIPVSDFEQLSLFDYEL